MGAGDTIKIKLLPKPQSPPLECNRWITDLYRRDSAENPKNFRMGNFFATALNPSEGYYEDIRPKKRHSVYP